MIFHIHKDITDEFDTMKIAKEFIAVILIISNLLMFLPPPPPTFASLPPAPMSSEIMLYSRRHKFVEKINSLTFTLQMYDQILLKFLSVPPLMRGNQNDIMITSKGDIGIFKL